MLSYTQFRATTGCQQHKPDRVQMMLGMDVGVAEGYFKVLFGIHLRKTMYSGRILTRYFMNTSHTYMPMSKLHEVTA
jgi:hypothetical protein